jgi:hypothetical protein
MEFDEVKTRAANKSGSIPAVTPSKRVKFEGYMEADEAFVLIEVPSAIKTLLRPAVAMSEEGAFTLTENAWDAVCAYLDMLDEKLPELQEVIVKSKLATTERVIGVEDELGDVVADLGSVTELPGGPYVHVWSDPVKQSINCKFGEEDLPTSTGDCW